MPKARSVRHLRCPHCGAPLTWKGNVNVVECRYCQTHVIVQSGQQTQAPAGAVAHKPVPVVVWIVAAAGTVFIGAIFTMVAFVNAARGTATGVGAGRATAAEIAAAPLNSTPEQMAKRYGVKVHGKSVHVYMDDQLFESAHFNWNEKHLEHVSSIALRHKGDEPPPEVLQKTKQQLGRLLRGASTGGYQFNGHRVNLSYSSSLGIHAHTFDDPLWKERLAALWTVLKGAALGTTDQLDDATKRDILNIENPIDRLLEIRFDIEVDNAEREVHRAIPGAVTEKERHDVGLNHPWFERAMLRWENEAGGKWSSVFLYYPKEFSFKAQRTELERCLEPVLGKPKVTVRDHLAGDVYLTYDAKEGLPYVHVGDQSLSLSLQDKRSPVTRRGFHRVLEKLSKCR